MATRAQIEVTLIARCGKILTACGLDGVTVDGTNASLTDPLGWALRSLNVAPATYGTVTSAEVAAVAADEIDKLLDFAELKALENALGNFDAVDISVGARSEKYDQIRTGLERTLERKQKAVERKYGAQLGTISGGVIALDFAQKGDE